jgi:hypothetical protein
MITATVTLHGIGDEPITLELRDVELQMQNELEDRGHTDSPWSDLHAVAQTVTIIGQNAKYPPQKRQGSSERTTATIR